MNNETVYLKIAQMTEVYKPEVFVKDIAEVHCQNRIVEAKIKAIKVATLKPNGKQHSVTYIGSVVDLLRQMETIEKNLQINNIGQTDFVVKYSLRQGKLGILKWGKTAAVSVISFCGAAFAIMTFNNDASVTDVFGNIYQLVMGVESDGVTILECSYSLGIALGIVVFFNHFASYKLTEDPTPIEVEMRLYEENVGKTLIQNRGRKERSTDVS